jgi:hypothetical protein
MGQGSNSPDFAGPKARGRGLGPPDRAAASAGRPAAFTEAFWSARRARRRVPPRFAGVLERAREGKQ